MDRSGIIDQPLNKNNIIKKYESHKKNEKILKLIYIGFSIFSIILNTIVSLFLGSDTIHNPQNKMSMIGFIFNVSGNIILSVINFLKLESKIEKHKHTKSEYQELLMDWKDILDEVKLERLKMINSHAPSICFN